MNDQKKRTSARSQTWADTEATVRVADTSNFDKRKTRSITGQVSDISAGGMFLKTAEPVPVPVNAEAEIEIKFDPANPSSRLVVRARGKTVRLTEQGIGMQFISIDLSHLQSCIIEKMNHAG